MTATVNGIQYIGGQYAPDEFIPNQSSTIDGTQTIEKRSSCRSYYNPCNCNSNRDISNSIMSKLEVDAIEPQSGTTITIGSSGDTVNLVGTLQSNGSPLPGDISSVVAGTGLSGGGTTGAVTLNIEAAQPTITSLGTITTFRSTGIDDNADATAITINSSEQVILHGGQIQNNNNTSSITYSGGKQLKCRC